MIYQSILRALESTTVPEPATFGVIVVLVLVLLGGCVSIDLRKAKLKVAKRVTLHNDRASNKFIALDDRLKD